VEKGEKEAFAQEINVWRQDYMGRKMQFVPHQM